MAKKLGKCALCGSNCELSFEHIPPKSAFNSKPIKPVSAMEMLAKKKGFPWETEGLPYQNLQKGMGLDSLCKQCNSDTGHWYGGEYAKFSQRIALLAKSDLDPNYQSVEIKEVYPLRIIKQVVSMFCSVNPQANIDDLRKFVLDKNAIGIDKTKYKICMYFTRSNVKRFFGLHGGVDIIKGTNYLLSEITAFPLGFLLYFDPVANQKYKGIDITGFADSSYEECCSVKMPIVFYEVNNWLAHDYRSKEEIAGTIALKQKEE